MTTKIEYGGLSGGLDLLSGALNIKPGMLLGCENFEQLFGVQGYRRIPGYERFDGRPAPHEARYHVLEFASGSQALVQGDALDNGLGATARVLQVRLDSGSYGGGDAEGVIYAVALSGVWTDGDPIKVGATQVATLAEDARMGAMSDGDYLRRMHDARELIRADIQKVPGEGPVRGVGVFGGKVVAARNDVGNVTASLYASSITGWNKIRGGLLPHGKFQFTVANFSGASTTMALFGCDGKNSPFKWDGTTFTLMAPIFGSQGTSTTSLAVATGAQTFTVVEAARSWKTGEPLVIWSRANAANQMIGTVTSYTGSTLMMDVTAVGGSGTFADWEIGRADDTDVPYLITAHKDHLFLAYPKGQLQTSNLGDPMTYTTSAALFGMGDELTGLVSMRGDKLGIFCRGKVAMLDGSSVATWAMQDYSKSAGAKMGTACETGGNALFLDARGLTSLQATQAYGDFEPAIFSRNVKPLMDAAQQTAVAARLAKQAYQYRLYLDNGTVLTAAILTPEAVIQPRDVSFTQQRYPHPAVCLGEGGIPGDAQAMFFGTADGWVMQESVGQSFDGETIVAVLRLAYNHSKSPSTKKRYRKLELEMSAKQTVVVLCRQQFDYSDGKYPASPSMGAEATVGGAVWGGGHWDEFLWSATDVSRAQINVSGVGRNMGLLLWNEEQDMEPFILQGMVVHYSPLGLAR